MASLYESLAQQVNSLHTGQTDQAPSEYLNHSIDSRKSYPHHYSSVISPVALNEAAPQLSEHWTRYCFSEAFGTFIAAIVTDYTVYTLSDVAEETRSPTNFLFLALGIGAAYFLGILIAVDANLNAMFTFALAICRAKPWRMVPIMIISQFIGGTAAHLLFYFMIGSPKPLDDGVAFCFGITPPPENITNDRILVSSIVFNTILLMALIQTFSPDLGGDANRSHFGMSMIVGLIISAVSIPAINAAPQMNPTYFFSAFMAMVILGFDEEYFTVHHNYWWTALVGPLLGVIVGLSVLTVFNVMQWNEPRDWKIALKKMINPPSD